MYPLLQTTECSAFNEIFAHRLHNCIGVRYVLNKIMDQGGRRVL
jgi:hypothetical protein